MKLHAVFSIRIIAAICLVIVIGVGLFARMQRAGADVGSVGGFLAMYLGDVLWAVMFFLLGRILFPQASRGWLAVGTLVVTLALEFSQLWQPQFLQWLRSLPVIGFLLGNSFVWSDVVCLLLGTGLAVLLDVGLRYVVRLWGEGEWDGDG